MRKTFCVAAREFKAAVYTKTFIISIILLPLMMLGGFLAQSVSQKIGDQTTKNVAVIDRTPDATLFPVLERAAEDRNKTEIIDKKTGRQMHSKFVLEKIEPAPIKDADAVTRQRFELSERIRNGDLFAIVEIGQDVLKPKISVNPLTAVVIAAKAESMSMDEKMDAAEVLIGESNLIRYTSNRPTYMDLSSFLQRTLPGEISRRRLKAADLPVDKVMPLMVPPQIANRGLIARDATGKLVQDKKVNQASAALIPIILMLLMFMVVLVGTSPLAMNVIEEKQLRIAEVLLGSARPFELMMGKLLGGAGVALTLGSIYVGGILVVANKYGVAGYVSPSVLTWFLIFTVVSTFMYGSLFVAAGAAVTNAKEAQSLITPIMLFITLPLFMIQPMLHDPSGPVPLAASFFPLSAPMMTTARIAIPPGIPLWQALLSIVISLLTTVGLVWCAGRIFRVGLLLQGQAAKPRELLKWVLRD